MGVAVGLFLFLALCLIWSLNTLSVSPRVGSLADQGQPAGNEVVPVAEPVETEENAGRGLLFRDVAQFFVDFPLNQKPYRHKFGELGRRTRLLRDATAYLDSVAPAGSSTATEDRLLLEQAATSLFPFLDKPPRNTSSRTPLSDLRSSIVPGSAGIVIPTGDRTVRYAAHLIAQLRQVLGSELPIQVVYAGDGDLSAANRSRLAAIPLASGPPLEFLDIHTVFDDSALLRFTSSATGGWALKAFAALGARFEKVIVLDADAVFLQRPEDGLLEHPAFRRTGALLFHDRLLWQHAFADRHAWWRAEIRRPSAQMDRSLVWTQEYAEECDSGVVVLDKGRLEVLMGLLHVCWQNTAEVREDCTYRMTYGDKESWWMGLELAGSGYEFSAHYGGIVGWEEQKPRPDGRPRVCSFVIAHVDAADRPLWYNGGLLKNKMTDPTGYEVPGKFMIDGTWEKGGRKEDMSCMVDGTMKDLSEGEKALLARSIDKAKEMDLIFHSVSQN